MSLYLEIPHYEHDFPFRSFISQGWEITNPHWHRDLEFIYCLEGTVNLGADGEIITLAEGDLFFFPSAQPHFFLASPDSRRLVFQFDLLLFQEVQQKFGQNLEQLYDRAAKHSQQWPSEVRQQLIGLFLQIHEEEVSKKSGWQYGVLGGLYQINRLIYQLPPTSDAPQPSGQSLRNKQGLEQLNLILEYVERHYDRPFSQEEAAAIVGFSPSYFSRFFKRMVGQSFSHYLMDYRLNQAKYILGTEELPMDEVAARTGFASVKTFHHVFKKRIGVAPLQFRKQLRATP